MPDNDRQNESVGRGRGPAFGPVVFTHVPKTAGRSIHDSVHRWFGLPRALVITGPALVEQLRSGATGTADWIYVGGHIQYPDAVNLFPSAYLIASLRDPVERILSHFFYALREGHVRLLAGGEDVVDAFAEFYANQMRSRQDNLLCRYLCGEPSAQAAIAKASDEYTMVWHAKRTRAAWPIVYTLCSRVAHPGSRDPAEAGIPPLAGEGKAHAAPVAGNQNDLASGARPSNYTDFLPDEFRGRICDEHAQDIQLIDWLAGMHDGLFIKPTNCAGA